MAEERQKNVGYLKRIGRYPYRRVNSVIEDSTRLYQTPQRERVR
jgi:hypothetical protein